MTIICENLLGEVVSRQERAAPALPSMVLAFAKGGDGAWREDAATPYYASYAIVTFVLLVGQPWPPEPGQPVRYRQRAGGTFIPRPPSVLARRDYWVWE